MPWVITVDVDFDKVTSPAVGTALAVFTDADGSTFPYSERARFTAAAADAFVAAAIAAKNSWQSRKTSETGATNTLVTKFNAAGEQATAGASK